ncbi:MAG: transglycosylase SLT domain-containing protein [Acidimicrobiales bacterium]
MTYVDGLPGVLAEIGQIQSTFSSLPSSPAPVGFEAVLQQISSLSGLAPPGSAGTTAPATGTTPSAGGTTGAAGYGWPLEEGGTLAATAPAQEAAPGGVAPPGEGLGEAAASAARKWLGVPYQWGGTDPAQGGVDCSGLVQDVYASLGVELPRTSEEQATVGVAVPSLADAQPGDLVFFPGSDGTAASPGHVGIYIGGGEMIDAPHTGTDVRVEPVGDPTAIRRVSELPSTSAPATYEGGFAGASPTYESSLAGASPTYEGSLTGASPTYEGSLAGAPATYQGNFAGAAATYGVPEALLAAVASTESGFEPGAVSSAGAEGLMQLMPATASSLGVDPFNPAQAIDGAARLLSSYYDHYGSWPLALAAYNAGPGAVAQYSGVPPYPETEAYVQNVLSRAGMAAQ